MSLKKEKENHLQKGKQLLKEAVTQVYKGKNSISQWVFRGLYNQENLKEEKGKNAF